MELSPWGAVCEVEPVLFSGTWLHPLLLFPLSLPFPFPYPTSTSHFSWVGCHTLCVELRPGGAVSEVEAVFPSSARLHVRQLLRAEGAHVVAVVEPVRAFERARDRAHRLCNNEQDLSDQSSIAIVSERSKMVSGWLLPRRTRALFCQSLFFRNRACS